MATDKPYIARSDNKQEFCAHCCWWRQLDGNGGTTGHCDNPESRHHGDLIMARHKIIDTCFKGAAKRGNEN